MKQVYLASLFLSILLPVTLFAQEKVLVFGETLIQSTALRKDLTEKNLQMQPITANSLSDISVDQGRLLLIAGDTQCPAQSRQAISNYLTKGGNLVVIGEAAFDYTPKPIKPVVAVDFGNSNNYQIIEPPRKPRLASMEKPAIQTVNLPNSMGKGLEFSTKEKGMRDVYAQFSIAAQSAASRSVLAFKAKGNHYMDLLSLQIKDRDNKKWITFVPLTLDWEEYTVSLADFIPEGWNASEEMYPLLDPNRVDSLAMGANLMTVWREKAMTFAIGDVSLCENETGIYAPTSALLPLTLPFQENDITFPKWIIDPFFQSIPQEGLLKVVSTKGSPFGNLERQDIKGSHILANTLAEFPGSLNGTDTKKDYDHRSDREKRIIPLLTTEDGRTVAHLDIHAGGIYGNASIAAFGIQPTQLVNQSDLRGMLVNVAHFILNTPRVLKIAINTTTQKNKESVVPKFIITLQNPTAEVIKGKLSLNIAGTLQKKVDVEIAPRKTLERIIQFGEVPADFSFKQFDWTIALETPNSHDHIQETVDIERSMLEAFIHLVKIQKKYPDGRYSHHYFGDAYGVRAMFAYLDFLDRNPQHFAKNSDLWQKISPADIRESAIRFCDMLVERQLPNGALPMGYSEHASGYNVADGGQMALALFQLSRYVKNETKRKAYLDVCYRFLDWAETFYIDEAKSDSLKVSRPKDYAKGNAAAGLYGLGQAGRSRQETGPSWVLADILAAQTYAAYIDSGPNNEIYRKIADRNIKFYANAKYSAAGYYQAEALFWAWLTTDDKAIKKVILENLDASFLPPLYRGKLNDMYDLGSRSTLRALPLLYYQQFMSNTASNRAVLLKYIWSFGANTSMSSMRNLSQTFPKPVHGESLAAAKYAALSALWSMELLEPGATLFQEVK
ncbi:hypothetical protein H8B21_14650 [Sphingobacterium chuzhouense]|uniref:Uncharacterized protein n=2 Tax=Sphingobacterium chuzhouense TaxID=1742264 RepID=A0ABR7XUU1_9SPHI|nr:hypothetical protein [Sphingobacterium chuzhouense]